MMKKSFHIIVLTLLSFCLHEACNKHYREYSYERRPVQRDTIPTADSSATVTLRIPFCAGCFEMDDFIEGRWSFKTGDNFACGIIDTAIVSPDRTALTFFGPSECSNDTGAIFTLFPAIALTKDLSNVSCSNSSFEYYDNIGGGDILVTRATIPMQYIIESYNHSTKIAQGVFNGSAFTKANVMYSFSGKFKVKL